MNNEAASSCRLDGDTHVVWTQQDIDAMVAERDTLRAENERLRAELADVDTLCDPAGVVRESRLAKDENLMLREKVQSLRAELADADLLLGSGWQEAVSRAKGSGEASQVGALAIQCTRLAGDVAVLRAELVATDCSYSDEEAAHLDTIRLLEAAQAGAAALRPLAERVMIVHHKKERLEYAEVDWELEGSSVDDGCVENCPGCKRVKERDAALASDAGQAYQRRLAAAEAVCKDMNSRIIPHYDPIWKLLADWKKERDG